MLPFTPQREAGADLDARTVGRATLLASIEDKLRAAARTQGRPHVLLVGPHGSGKTHLVEVALHRAGADPAFASRMVVVRIPEDAVGITRFEDLPRAVLEHLAASPADGQDPLEVIDRALGERVALLVVENLDRVFDDLGLAGQRALRSWVETSGKVLLLATSPRLFPAVLRRDQPWFAGLAVFVLPALSPQEGRDLLLHSAQARADTAMVDFLLSPAGLARVHALAALTEAAPRAWTLIAAMADVGALDEVLPALLAVLEALVPQQQESLARLSPNERRLVVAMAAAGSGKVSDLAAAARLEQRTAAASLGRLADAGWVSGRKPSRADRRTTYYRLRDPMLRHHLQYRTGGDAPLPLTAALLRAHFDVAGSRAAGAHEPPTTALQHAQPDVAGSRAAVAEEPLTTALQRRDPRAAATAVLRSLRRVRAGSAVPALPGESSWDRLAALLLAAGGGDEIALLRLPQELHPLFDPLFDDVFDDPAPP